MVAYTALTAARVVTLPASSAFRPGRAFSSSTRPATAPSPRRSRLARPGRTRSMARLRRSSIRPMASLASRATAPGIGRSSTKASCRRWQNIAAAAHGATIQAQVLETLVTLSGASTNASLQIPANCIVLAVGARVVTAITGATSYEVGVTGNLSQFGSGLALRGRLHQFRADRSDRLLHRHDD